MLEKIYNLILHFIMATAGFVLNLFQLALYLAGYALTLWFMWIILSICFAVCSGLSQVVN